MNTPPSPQCLSFPPASLAWKLFRTTQRLPPLPLLSFLHDCLLTCFCANVTARAASRSSSTPPETTDSLLVAALPLTRRFDPYFPPLTHPFPFLFFFLKKKKEKKLPLSLSRLSLELISAVTCISFLPPGGFYGTVVPLAG